ncbi:cache domain-containing protein [Paenibacillus protaetiae]|uniref:cache domain-containing protein n=1 Tax=Paenibacillus protaetiae TaxID=2509456 RepID=UPI001FC93AED|nr:cache domain-containing protein [Paenibacillus protaetiae]
MKRKSIQFILSVSLSLFSVLVIIAVGLVLYSRFSATTKDNAFRNSQQIVDQVSYNLEGYIASISELFHTMDLTIAQGGDVTSGQLQHQLEMMMSTRMDTVTLALFDDRGQPIFNIPNVAMKKSFNPAKESWFKSALDTPGHLSISLPHVENFYSNQFRWVVTLSKSITVQKGGKPVNGVLLLDVNFNQIDQLSNRVSLGKKGYVYILDESAGNIVYHPSFSLYMRA